jgi:hypothetical protein
VARSGRIAAAAAAVAWVVAAAAAAAWVVALSRYEHAHRLYSVRL